MLRRVLDKFSLCLLVFNVYIIMGMVEELARAQLGVKLEERWRWALMYADDIALVADSGMEL